MEAVAGVKAEPVVKTSETTSASVGFATRLSDVFRWYFGAIVDWNGFTFLATANGVSDFS